MGPLPAPHSPMDLSPWATTVCHGPFLCSYLCALPRPARHPSLPAPSPVGGDHSQSQPGVCGEQVGPSVGAASVNSLSPPLKIKQAVGTQNCGFLPWDGPIQQAGLELASFTRLLAPSRSGSDKCPCRRSLGSASEPLAGRRATALGSRTWISTRTRVQGSWEENLGPK